MLKNLIYLIRKQLEVIFEIADKVGSNEMKLDSKFYFIAFKITWTIMSFLVLFVGIYAAIKHRDTDLQWIFIILLYIINFPASIVYAILVETIFTNLFSNSTMNDYSILGNISDNVLTWIMISICGYVQWSILLPKLINKIMNEDNE